MGFLDYNSIHFDLFRSKLSNAFAKLNAGDLHMKCGNLIKNFFASIHAICWHCYRAFRIIVPLENFKFLPTPKLSLSLK
jgi:hypothetical protein